MIVFDATYLVVFLNTNPPPAKDRNGKPVDKFKERVHQLASTFDRSNEPIGIPAPAMAEVLVRAGKGRSKLVSILSDRWRFQILPFDSRAAIEASELIAQIKASKEPWTTWAKVKFDIQIVAIARAENASVIYADDIDIENYAKRLKIPVVRICDLPLLPSPVEGDAIEGTIGTQGQLNLATAENEVEFPKAEPKSDASTGADKLVGKINSGSVESETPNEKVVARPCECGCGGFPKDPNSRFLPGHDLRKAYNDQKQTPQ